MKEYLAILKLSELTPPHVMPRLHDFVNGVEEGREAKYKRRPELLTINGNRKDHFGSCQSRAGSSLPRAFHHQNSD